MKLIRLNRIFNITVKITILKKKSFVKHLFEKIMSLDNKILQNCLSILGDGINKQMEERMSQISIKIKINEMLFYSINN